MEKGFYKSGGTLASDAPSYIMRQADTDLYEGLRRGEFCAILTSRQMGKSSLRNHVATRLRKEGVSVAELDLTSIGRNLTPEQWYDGLIYALGRELGLKRELNACWREHAHLGPLHRWMVTLQEGVLAQCKGPVVIFLDEIEVVRNLPFSTDEFFAAIRECYNRRATNPALQRLTFCILGMAAPADLIRDTQITPFNIGRQIELTDFTPDEARLLARGLPGNARQQARLLRRALYWTNGQPYLTQLLCQTVAETHGVTLPDVDTACHKLFLSPKARESNVNLVPVREYLLQSSVDRARLLSLYSRVRTRRRVPNDETNALVSLLRLSGIARVSENCLQVRNRIYARVFDRAWVVANMPNAELRRQRIAFRRGVGRATALSSIVVALMGMLVWKAERATLRADEGEREARQQLLDADMGLTHQMIKTNNVPESLALLDNHHDASQTFPWRYLWSELHTDIRTFVGHSLFVNAVAFSPDGSLLATAGSDGTAKIWNTATGQKIDALRGHTGAVAGAIFSSDGKQLATGGQDGTIRIWDVATGHELKRLTGHTGLIYSLAFAPNRGLLASGGEDREVRLWNVSTFQMVRRLQGFVHTVYSVAVSPDGTRLATANGDNSLTVWDTATGQKLHTLRKHNDLVLCVAFSSDGKRVASGSQDTTVKIWNVATGAEEKTLYGHSRPVLSLAFVPHSQWLVTGSEDSTARLWDVSTGQELHTYRGHTQVIASVAVSHDGRWLATGCRDGTAKLWDLKQQQNLRLQGNERSSRRYVFSPDGNCLVGFDTEGVFPLWDAVTGRALGALQNRPKQPGAVAFAPDGRQLAVCGEPNRIHLYDANTRQQVGALIVPMRNIRALAFSPDGKRLAVGDGDGTIQLVDVTQQRPSHLLGKHFDSFVTMAFSPDGNYLATGSWDHTAKIWNLTTNAPPQTFQGYKGVVETVAFSQDGVTLATGSNDGTVKLWDRATGREILTLIESRQGIESLAFASKDTILKAVSTDGTVLIWKAARQSQEALPSRR